MLASNRLVRVFSVIAAIGAIGQASWAVNYYVAPASAGGSDTNPGTSAAPFLTIQRAADVAQGGEFVYVQPGTYAGFNVKRNGTAMTTINFVGLAGAIINAPAAAYNGSDHKARINIDSVSNISITGFEIVGSNDLRNSRAGVRIVAPPGSNFRGIRLSNNHIHHHGQWGVLSGHVHEINLNANVVHHSYQQHGIYLSNSGDGHFLRGNISHSNAQQGYHFNGDASQGGDGVMSSLIIENNIAYNNAIGGTYIDTSGVQQVSLGGGSAINCDGVQNSRINSNLLYGNHASGISLYRIDGGGPSTGNVIINNTIVNGSPSNTNARWCINLADGSTGTTMFNNILLNYHPFRGSLIISTDSRPGLVSDYNLMMDRIDPGTGTVGTLAAWRTLSGQDVHSFVVPSANWSTIFADLGADDYRLRPGSPAVDAGIARLNNWGPPRHDLNDVERWEGAAVDIGAYELPDPCVVDFDMNGRRSINDVFAYLNAWFALDTPADINSSGDVTVQDIFDFLNLWMVTDC